MPVFCEKVFAFDYTGKYLPKFLFCQDFLIKLKSCKQKDVKYGMSLQKFIEEKIKQAIADGEFDNLKGAGKSLDFDLIVSKTKIYLA